MWWPFGPSAPAVTEEQRARLKRRCGLKVATLRNCLAANKDNPDACTSVEVQVTHCYAEVMDPEQAAKFEACFRKVVNSRGKVPYDSCQAHIDDMQATLKKQKLFPFVEK